MNSLRNYKAWLPGAVLVILALAVFSPLLLSGTFFWDDYLLILHNRFIQSPGLGGLGGIWFSTKNPDYFPLTSTTFWLEWRLWGESPRGYHLVNILLHAGSGILLWRIFRRLGVPGAFLIACVFVVHPGNAESVAWIAERKNTLSMCCMCGALLCYLRSEERGRWGFFIAALALFLLALLAKTAVVMLPFALLILAWLRRRRITFADLLRTVPFFLLSLALGLATLYFQHNRAIGEINVRDDSFFSRLATAGCALWFYLGRIMAPINITFNYPRWNVMSFGVVAFLPLGLLVALLGGLFGGCLAAHRRRGGPLGRRYTGGDTARQTLGALGIYVLMLLPILGFINIVFMRYSLVSDHWQYQAMPAILALVVGVAAWVYRRAPAGIRRALIALAIVIVAVFATYTFTLADTYRTDESIWRDTLVHNPDSWLAHGKLGELYYAQVREHPELRPTLLPLAIEHLQEVVKLQPRQSLGYTNLANVYLLAGQLDEARQTEQEALAAPDAAPGERAILHYNLAMLYARGGDFADAEDHAEKALKIDPTDLATYAPGFLSLARSEARAHRADLAAQLLHSLLAADPQNADASALLLQLTGTPSTLSAPDSTRR